MTGFRIHDLETAPAASRPLLQKYLDGYKFVPNMMAVMAESPELLAAYQALSGLWAQTALTPLERDVVLLAINAENACRYCMASQSTVSARTMPAEMLAALREGQPLADPKLQALRGFAETVVRKRGWVEEAEIAALLAAGYTRRTALEVVLAAAFKTLSNYTDHVTHAPVDPVFERFAWRPGDSAGS
jgi:alkylhydroperoxidase family enzyme